MLRKRNTDDVDACVLQTNGFMPCYNLVHFALQFGSFYAVIWLISCGEMV